MIDLTLPPKPTESSFFYNNSLFTESYALVMLQNANEIMWFHFLAFLMAARRIKTQSVVDLQDLNPN